MLWILAVSTGPVQASTSLNGAWRPVLFGDTPQSVMNDYREGRLKSFDPSHLQRFEVSALGSWVVIAPAPPWDNTERMLSIYPPPLGAVKIYVRNQVAKLALDDFIATAHGHGRLAWRIPMDQPASAPILLKFEPSLAAMAPVRFEIQPLNDYLEQDAQWLMFASASFAAMLLMVLMALCFAVVLRNMTFAWYAGIIFCYTFVQSIQTGFAFHPLEWHWLTGMGTTSCTVAQALSIVFAAIFLTRFCDLRTNAPILRVPTMTLAIGMLLLALMRCSQISLLTDIAQILLNPMLLIGAGLLLVSAIVAGFKGSRPAWFFLLGWTPLLILTAMSCAQASGALPSLDWLSGANLAGGAFESLVLSLGLADRALRLRHDRDKVRGLADHDALTGTFNRRAWSEKANAMLNSDEPHSVAMLFIDLDYFKQLNDFQGHNAGDRALVTVSNALGAELRPTDLLGRYGGEEFVVMVDDTTEEIAMHVATRLCRRVHRLEIPVNEKLVLSASIGVALWREGDDLESLVERADQAMYTAKVRGKNQVHLFGSDSPTTTPPPIRLHVVEKKRRREDILCADARTTAPAMPAIVPPRPQPPRPAIPAEPHPPRA